MDFDPMHYHYPSRRSVMYAGKGMVATSTPYASQAGLEVLKNGGNAIDAAVAAAACLTVVEPTSNGIGGDAFALVWSKDKLYGLNASGPAPGAISSESLRRKGYREMPRYGFEAVTVPGAPSAWNALSKKFGRLSLRDVLAPAIQYADEGYPLNVTVAESWETAYNKYSADLKEEQYKYWFDTFVPNGVLPRAGQFFRSGEMSETLRSIADTGAESFYRGGLAEKIIDFSRKYGGYFTEDDFKEYYPEWVEPISINYRGYTIHEIPPNGHGITALLALNILNGFEFDGSRENLDTYHKHIESIKLSFADAKKYVADARAMKVKAADLLSESYATERRKLIDKEAISPAAGNPYSGGTVYLAASDGEGNMVSYIQSNYMGFGSGLVVPGTGIALHNRGNNFSLEEGHANCIEGGKKPYHTIIPGFMTKEKKAVGPFGVMGGFMQPQGHLQVVANTIDFHLNPQDALNAPRWQWIGGRSVEVEKDVPAHIVQGLADKGHDVKLCNNSRSMGRGQIIWKQDNGALCGGTEPRADGCIAVW